LEQQLRT